MTIKECAKIMGCSEQFLRIGLQQGRIPFGIAVRTTPRRWTYFIDDEKFKKWKGDKE